MSDPQIINWHLSYLYGERKLKVSRIKRPALIMRLHDVFLSIVWYLVFLWMISIIINKLRWFHQHQTISKRVESSSSRVTFKRWTIKKNAISHKTSSFISENIDTTPSFCYILYNLYSGIFCKNLLKVAVQILLARLLYTSCYRNILAWRVILALD